MKADIQISDEVRAVLDRSVIEGNLLKLPPEQLDRKLYTRVNETLEALGGKWNKGKKAHVFEADPRAAIGKAKDEGKVTHPNQYDFFPTSRDVAETACHRLGMGDGWKRTLEPSAGEGHLFAPLVDWLGEPLTDDLTLFELDPKRCAALRGKGVDRHLMKGDFLGMRPEAFLPFDRILMNPPFEKKSDVRHIAHALKFLAPGGRLVAIASAGLSFRTDKATKALRDLILEDGTIEDLPDGSFEQSGTSVATVLIVYDKPAR